MKQALSKERSYNSRFTIVEKNPNLVQPIKKSKTRITDKQSRRKPSYFPKKNQQKPKQSSLKIEAVDIQDIFQTLVEKVDSRELGPRRKLKIDPQGMLKIVLDQKEGDRTCSKSKLELFSGSLVNNYWTGDSSLMKGGFSRLEDQTILEISEQQPSEDRVSVSERLKKTSERARELVGGGN